MAERVVPRKQEYIGALRTNILRGPEYSIHNLQQLIVTIGSGASDIGKGWTTSAIAAQFPRESTAVIKYDPMFNADFPDGLGVVRNGHVVSEDVALYESVGVRPDMITNIVGGDVLNEFAESVNNPPHIDSSHIKKLTLADLSTTFCDMLLADIQAKNPKTVVMEVGGIVDDTEKDFLPQALRLFGIKTGISPQIVLLTYFDYSEVNDHGTPRKKTQTARNAIRNTLSKYPDLSIKGVLVRRRQVPDAIQDSELEGELERVAYETGFDPQAIHYLPNMKTIPDLTKKIGETNIVSESDQQVFISACLMGANCRYDGTSARFPVSIPNQLLSKGMVVTGCPEVYAGMPTPRGPYHIEGGDGNDVLDGKARVMDRRGNDVTERFIDGAIKTLQTVRKTGCHTAVLTSHSPSCNALETRPTGVTTALLRRWGIQTVSDKTFTAYSQNSNQRRRI